MNRWMICGMLVGSFKDCASGVRYHSKSQIEWGVVLKLLQHGEKSNCKRGE